MGTASQATPGKILLIVEDEIIPAMVLRDELEDAGYRVLELTAYRHEAILAAQQCAPDLALVNIQLHGRDDGIALARDLKAMGVPVLFISGQVDRARSAQTVAIGSLPKPYSAASMVLAVNYLLRPASDIRLAPPSGLEVFDWAVRKVAPDAA
jgi:1,2-diacylglycerol 3-beta-glucosyltransferase